MADEDRLLAMAETIRQQEDQMKDGLRRVAALIQDDDAALGELSKWNQMLPRYYAALRHRLSFAGQWVEPGRGTRSEPLSVRPGAKHQFETLSEDLIASVAEHTEELLEFWWCKEALRLLGEATRQGPALKAYQAFVKRLPQANIACLVAYANLLETVWGEKDRAYDLLAAAILAQTRLKHHKQPVAVALGDATGESPLEERLRHVQEAVAEVPHDHGVWVRDGARLWGADLLVHPTGSGTALKDGWNALRRALYPFERAKKREVQFREEGEFREDGECGVQPSMPRNGWLDRDEGDVEALVVEREQAREAIALIGTLAPREHEAYLLVKGYDLTYREAAQRMGCEPRTVEALLRSAEKKLKPQVEAIQRGERPVPPRKPGRPRKTPHGAPRKRG